MKTGNHTTNKSLIATILVVICILLSGCNKHNLLEPTTSTETQNPNDFTIFSTKKIVDLVIGEETLLKVGTVVIRNHASGSMEVSYTMIAPWKINSARLFIGSTSQIPVNSSGDALPDNFQYKQNLPLGGSPSVTFIIPTTAISGCRTAAAQAMVYNSETLSVAEAAWGRGTRISPTDLGMYYPYCVSDFRADQELD